MRTDTIAAVATAAGSAGIGIIRISGENAIAVADCVYRSKNNQKKLADAVSHTIHYGFIYYQGAVSYTHLTLPTNSRV